MMRIGIVAGTTRTCAFSTERAWFFHVELNTVHDLMRPQNLQRMPQSVEVFISKGNREKNLVPMISFAYSNKLHGIPFRNPLLTEMLQNSSWLRTLAMAATRASCHGIEKVVIEKSFSKGKANNIVLACYTDLCNISLSRLIYI